MTGKELMLFILENNLTDVELLPDETFLVCVEDMFLTKEEAACKLGIGIESLCCMYKLNLISGVVINGEIFFPKDVKLPNQK